MKPSWTKPSWRAPISFVGNFRTYDIWTDGQFVILSTNRLKRPYRRKILELQKDRAGGFWQDVYKMFLMSNDPSISPNG